MSTSKLTPDMWLLPAPTDRQRSARPRVVAVGGDGIGPEIVAAAVSCLRATGAPLDIVEPAHGEHSLRQEGAAFPERLRTELDSADAILFGAVDTGPRGHCRPILRYIRFGLSTYANIRPAALLPALPSITGGAGANLVIVRELTEGAYPGCEAGLAELGQRWPELRDALGRPLPAEGRFSLTVVTEAATLRIARYAAALALHRQRLGVGRGHVTIVTKANVLRQSDGLFRDLCEQEISKVDGITCDHVYVDEAARRLVASPATFDVIVTTNLYGDILSDVAAEIMGGMPMAPSAGIGDGHAYFESCHGSAPDIAGQDIANPAATILSAAMLLSYLGFAAHARRLMQGLLGTIAAGCATADLGGDATTSGFAAEVCRRSTPAELP